MVPPFPVSLNSFFKLLSTQFKASFILIFNRLSKFIKKLIKFKSAFCNEIVVSSLNLRDIFLIQSHRLFRHSAFHFFTVEPVC